jgi:hypothetical protein
VQTLDGYGRLVQAPVSARPVPADALDSVILGPAHPPGFYGTEATRQAVNLGPRIRDFRPLSDIPAGAVRAGYTPVAERALDMWFYLGALAFLLLDGIATLFLRGQLPGMGSARAGMSVAALLLIIGAFSVAAAPASAQTSDRVIGPAIGAQPPGSNGLSDDESFALRAASATTLAFVRTGDAAVDRVSSAGLSGLSAILRQRTAVEAAEPLGIDVNKDELAFFPLLYWPVTDSQPSLHQGAIDRLNRYLANGGTILFDTRDAHIASGRMQAASGILRRLTQGLDIPELTPVPPEHVLTKSFYLMQDYPGRWAGSTLWIEKPGTAVNDGVARVMVGSADWSGAWAIDSVGRPMFAVVPGGERQREMSYRFGVNLVMYALTGNYKADQVHVPAILERLGQ